MRTHTFHAAFIPLALLVFSAPTFAQQVTPIQPHGALADQTASTPVQPFEQQLFVMGEHGMDTLAFHPGMVQLSQGQPFSIVTLGDRVRTIQSNRLAAIDQRWSRAQLIPEHYFVWGEAADGSVTTKQTRLLFLPSRSMQYNPETETFEGSILIVLEDQTAPARGTPLAEPVPIEITSDADTVTPSEISLGHANFPSTEVHLVDDAPTDSLGVTIRTQANLEGYALNLGVEPAIVIDTRRTSMHGWGFQCIDLPVILKGTSTTSKVTVSLDVDKGHLESSEVDVSGSSPGHVKLRSESLGAVTVRASAAGYSTAEIEIRYGFPLAFILAALLGGLLGGIIGYFRRRQKSQSVSFANHVGMGIVWGVVWAVAYGVMGIVAPAVNVPVYEYFNEGIVFVVSALSAIYMQPRKKE